MFTLLSALIAASAVLAIIGQYRSRALVYLFKPLTTTLIIVLAWTVHSGEPNNYFWLILAGLVFSLAGDVFLMLPKDRFVAGLVSFLVAHILYIIAFSSTAGFLAAPMLAIPYALGAGVLLAILLPKAGPLALPVIVYAAALATMGWQAASHWQALHDHAALCAMVGAILFMISDSLLAFNKFARPFHAAQAALLSTYFAAQWLIAQSA